MTIIIEIALEQFKDDLNYRENKIQVLLNLVNQACNDLEIKLFQEQEYYYGLCVEELLTDEIVYGLIEEINQEIQQYL